jgi:anti-sigma regulatory factor (Ser/Thr protein kinase)
LSQHAGRTGDAGPVSARTAPVAEPRLCVEVVSGPQVPSLLSSLVRAYLVDGLRLDAHDALAARLRLAVVETVTNVVRHAYRDSEPGPVRLELSTEGADFVARLHDRGPRFDPRESTAELPRPHEMAEGGYGVPILHEVMDRVDHDWSEDGGNVLTLRKRWR